MLCCIEIQQPDWTGILGRKHCDKHNLVTGSGCQLGTITTQTITKCKLKMMTQNAHSLTGKARHSTPGSFLRWHPDVRGESLTADPLLRGRRAQRALPAGSIYTRSRIGAHGHIWSAVWKLLLAEAFHWLRCFWQARVAGVRDLGHSVYVTPVTTWLAGSSPKPRLLALTLPFQQLRSFGLYGGGCTCHTPPHDHSHDPTGFSGVVVQSPLASKVKRERSFGET